MYIYINNSIVLLDIIVSFTIIRAYKKSNEYTFLVTLTKSHFSTTF